MSFRRFPFFSLLALLALAGCSSKPQPTSQQTPQQIQARVVKLLPAHVRQKAEWAGDIATALRTQQIEASDSHICAIVAVADQETNFNVDAPVSGLSKIAWGEINKRAARLHIPAFLVRTALLIKSSNGRSYADRLDSVRSEKELSAIFDDFIDMVPMGRTLFGNLNPIHTGGPMQVSIAFAEANAKGYPWPVKEGIRQEVFTRHGGIWFGVKHLLGYPASYSEPLYRFADFNAGWYASRNAAFQAAVARATGMKLALDGDLILYNTDKAGATELAVRTLGKQLGMSDRAIRRDLEKGDSADFEQSKLWKQLFTLADSQAGRTLPRQMLPGIQLESPKITRKLTTAWFAQRVNSRYQQCMARR
ncbi:DUF1615 domain-containing protein [Mixta tenebrionis]|uniref:DUF1615 domain-containing protein n=1 Tax=Mixta tenebrionis TaxID=2562439 RepID=UPI00362E1198